MALTVGERLGPYEIIELIGAGGMGQVYRARDPRLNRDVAIKVSQERFSDRFEREARAVAALNHPNICTLYDVGPNYLVMELIEGESPKGPLPLDEALRIARQVADALEAAHEKGIVHRDLKPANIKITGPASGRPGTVKVLDFGLALVAQASACESDPQSSPTITISPTRAGMILGTAAYMSPEQARGTPVDRRADIWAFGVVLYELLTGRAAFAGETVTDILASVMKEQPDLTVLPEPVRTAVQRCLSKDVRKRWGSIGDVRWALEGGQADAAEAAHAQADRKRRLALGLGAAFAFALASAALIYFRFSVPAPPPPAAVRFEVAPQEGGSFGSGFMALSPDGRQLAFVARAKDGPSQLWIRALDSLEARPLAGTAGAVFPFWSPDSRFLAFSSADQKLKKIAPSGGPVQTLASLPSLPGSGSGMPGGLGIPGGDWTREGEIFLGSSEGLFRVGQAGGDPVQVTRLDTAHGETFHSYPQILPGGRQFLYLVVSAASLENSGIYVGSLDGSLKRRLVTTNRGFRYTPPVERGTAGHLLFVRDQTLMAQPFDPKALNVMGDAFPIAERVRMDRSYAAFSTSENGALAYYPGVGGTEDTQLTWFDRSGKPLGTLGALGSYNNVALSRDGARAAVSQSDQSNHLDIWLIDTARGIPTRFTFDQAADLDPAWAPDGSRLAYASSRGGGDELFVKSSSGAGKEERIPKTGGVERPCDWSPDGRSLMYVRSDAKRVLSLWVLSGLDGDPAHRQAAPYLETPFSTTQCQFSPDGRWVAYTSNEAANGNEVYVQSYPAGPEKVRISSTGGSQPTPGSRVGHYEIVGPLGAGGMGEVYRARDTKLKRDVALKVLPAAFARDPERLARFTREAEVLAAHNHPNIATIYGEEEGALVMELVEGETLAEIVQRGPLPLDTALAYAGQIADALEAAHEKGIVHRDLKPANVKVTPERRVKVLDFGLAAVMQTASASAAGDPTDSPTLTISPTRAGMILGTAAYMSPEQARGSPVDKRTDVWAFGAVLYEMLAGRAAFAGDTVTDILASVVKEQPDLTVLPAQVRTAVGRCLSKDPRKRCGSMGDVRWALENGQAEAVRAAHAQADRMRRLALGLAAAFAFALASVALIYFRLPVAAPPPGKLVRFQIPLPEKTTLLVDPGIALSPDGSKLAYYARDAASAPRLWVRAMDTLESRPLPGAELASEVVTPPFWSPDSRWLVFNAGGTALKKIAVTGGPPQTLCNPSNNAPGGAWNRDGVILLGNSSGPLLQVSAAGGTAVPVTTVDASAQENHRFPFFLPDGRHFLYLRTSSAPEYSGIYLGSLDAKPDRQATRRVALSDYGPVFLPPAEGSIGELLLLREGALLAQPFDLARMEVAGDAVPVAEQVGAYLGFGFFSASANGTLVYLSGANGQNLELTLFDRQGKSLGRLGEPGDFTGVPAFSPDGKQLAVARRMPGGSKANLWLLDLTRNGVAPKFTFGGAQDFDPVWSPDGSRLVFSSNRDGVVLNLYRKVASGARDEEILLKSDRPKFPSSWSRDGRFLLYSVVEPKTRSDLWILPVPTGTAGAGTPVLFQGSAANETDGQFSPDGRWIAYVSDESGRNEVYVREFVLGADGKPEATAHRLVSNGGGSVPRWREDGKELVYLAPDRKTVMSVEISTQPSFHAAPPVVLFALPAAASGVPAMAPDGKRFVALMPPAQNGPETFNVVLNFAAALKR